MTDIKERLFLLSELFHDKKWQHSFNFFRAYPSKKPNLLKKANRTWGTFCRENVVYDLWAKKKIALRADPAVYLPWLLHLALTYFLFIYIARLLLAAFSIGWTSWLLVFIGALSTKGSSKSSRSWESFDKISWLKQSFPHFWSDISTWPNIRFCNLFVVFTFVV